MPESPITLPPLEAGDRLTRAEFHRRYCLRADIHKAELIDGVVYVPSPVYRPHALRTSEIAGWLWTYAVQHPGVGVYDNVTVMLSDTSEVQPDICLVREEPGGTRLTEMTFVESAPPLVVEVAATSKDYDLGPKLRAYERAGVQEYLVWRIADAQFDWFRLQDGKFVRVEPDENGIIESSVFPGLRLVVAKLLADDMPGVLAALGPATPA